MPQILLPDNIPALVKASSTTCTLASTSMGQPTRITIGGQQYKLSSTLTLNTATTGLGGLDTGVLGSAHQLYYVYACANSSGVVGLVASQAAPSTGPSGFTSRNKLVGAFYVRDVAEIGSTVTIEGTATTIWTAFTPVFGNIPGTGSGFWRRNGDTIELENKLAVTGAATGNIFSGIPSGLTLNSSSIVAGSNNGALGIATATQTNFFTGNVTYNNGVAANAVIFVSHNTSAIWNATVPATWANGHVITANFKFPISGWNKTLLG